jgi:hypothetical protein
MPNRGAAVSTALSRRQKSARKKCLLKISCNPLISLDSVERIQGNPSFSNPQNLGFSQRNGTFQENPNRADHGVATAVEKEPNRLHPNAQRSSRIGHDRTPPSGPARLKVLLAENCLALGRIELYALRCGDELLRVGRVSPSRRRRRSPPSPQSRQG